MRSIIVGVVVEHIVLGMWCAPVLADGGTMRWSETKAGYRITVFTAPAPLRAGAVDISALVQEASTGDPATDVNVTVRMTKPRGLALEYPATSEAATNKLFRAAQFELPEPGHWALEVQVQGSHGLAVVGGDLDAAERLPHLTKLWPWISWPALAIALFGIHRYLTRQRDITVLSTNGAGK